VLHKAHIILVLQCNVFL